MPITEELKTAQELRAAGAAPALAELLAAKLEVTAAATRDATFRDFLAEMKTLHTNMDLRFANMRTEMDLRFANMDVRFAKLETLIAESKASHEASMRGFMAAMIAALGVAVAIIKLFPNLH